MDTLITELTAIANDAQNCSANGESSTISGPLERLTDSAQAIGKAWSQSWAGNHALIYYRDFQPPPAGAHFSIEWGLEDSRGRWTQYSDQDVRRAVLRRAEDPDLNSIKAIASQTNRRFYSLRDQLTSILHAALSEHSEPYLQSLLEKSEKCAIPTSGEILTAMKPSSVVSRDSDAVMQGIWIPPHLKLLAEATSFRLPFVRCGELSRIASLAASHMERLLKQQRRAARIGTNVFIGHGRSAVWKDLKDFVQDRLRLPWDEFNRVPVAGVTNITRLSEMLDAAAIAFIVMTAEDELIDGQMQARLNVVHEAGLFQGRLGFTKSILLIEEGCLQFSNIEGLGQIRFAGGNISAAFEEIRRVLEREGVISV